MKFTDKDTKVQYNVVRLKKNPQVLISDNLFLRIHKYHTLHHDLEWSGQLLFKTNTAKITELDKMVIVAEEFIPMDLGNVVATDINFRGGHEDATKYIPDFWDDYRIEDSKEAINSGCIHSHHNMSTFFSTVDQPSLLAGTKAAIQFMYVSLIVNYETFFFDFKGRWKCRVAFRTSPLTNGKHAFVTNSEIVSVVEEPTIAYADCIVDHAFKYDKEDLAVVRYKELLPQFHTRYQHDMNISKEFIKEVYKFMSDNVLEGDNTALFLNWCSTQNELEKWFNSSVIVAVDFALEAGVNPFPKFHEYDFEDGHIHMLVFNEIVNRLGLLKDRDKVYSALIKNICLEIKKFV